MYQENHFHNANVGKKKNGKKNQFASNVSSNHFHNANHESQKQKQKQRRNEPHAAESRLFSMSVEADFSDFSPV